MEQYQISEKQTKFKIWEKQALEVFMGSFSLPMQEQWAFPFLVIVTQE